MTEDELVKIWQSSPNQERVKFEKSRLIAEVQSGLNRLDREIQNRDRMDTMALVTAILAFTLGAYFIPFILTKIACGSIALWSIYLIMRRRKIKKNRKTGVLADTYIEHLRKNRQLLLDQKKLMHATVYLHVIPFIIFISLFLAGFMKQPWIKTTQVVALYVGAFMSGLVVYLMNKWAIKNQILPRLEKVDRLIEVMEKE